MSFFFFQAEDGIRDFHVTGVQTCALPISPPEAVASLREEAGEALGVVRRKEALLAFLRRAEAVPLEEVEKASRDRLEAGRSEERRVGKECRSRWSTAHEKKKTKE